MNWRAWFSSKKSQKPVQPLEELSKESPIECNPDLLSKFVMAAILGHMQGLENSANQTGISISDRQWASLFRQVCQFYDALAYYLIHSRIRQTGRISNEGTHLYVEQLRERIMYVIMENNDLPDSWRNWSLNATNKEMEADFNLYMHGVIPDETADDFQKIFNITRVDRNGSTSELVVRLQTRTFQILRLFPKPDPLIFMIWWQRQAGCALGFTEALQDKIIPVL